MSLSEVVLLAAIQGLTEFIPVSSSGHLLAARYLLGIDTAGSLAFDAYLHVGTLAAVLVYYRRRWLELLQAVVAPTPERAPARRLALALAVGTIPAAAAGFILRRQEQLFVSSPQRLALELLATAVIIALADRLGRALKPVSGVSYRDALLIGIAQIFALLPGVSRSGVTIAAARARGLGRQAAIDFSFLLSAPIIAGAGLVSFAEVLASNSVPALHLAIALAVSCLSGIAGIALLIYVARRSSFVPFSIYLVLLAAILWYVR